MRRGWPMVDAESQLPLRDSYRTCLVCSYRFFGEPAWWEDLCRGCAGWAAKIMGFIPGATSATSRSRMAG